MKTGNGQKLSPMSRHNPSSRRSLDADEDYLLVERKPKSRVPLNYLADALLFFAPQPLLFVRE
jgi:hypothetical protein